VKEVVRHALPTIFVGLQNLQKIADLKLLDLFVPVQLFAIDTAHAFSEDCGAAQHACA